MCARVKRYESGMVVNPVTITPDAPPWPMRWR